MRFSTIFATATLMLTASAGMVNLEQRTAAPALTEGGLAKRLAAIDHMVARKESFACVLCTANCGFGDGSDCTTCCAAGGPCENSCPK
ncbi:hypothetical protein GMOD_00002069 [Pyrenophora seminiperda CCB06]|uniref:Uncharacterized protein n=1 Tax=Pyrenophora seminiperda CCB06 TaxID=1302712 RepID=A0A3M7LWY4_9PLEO|nr:hypothetical protein GMOD_00002069 [Pyrenophora seminiperda CCB06]